MTTLHIPELAEALQRHNLALFVGADLPQEVTGLPSRTDLARELARRKGLDEALPLAEVAQRVSQAGNRWEFTDFIRNVLDTVGKSPELFHQRVAALVKEHQIETLITTAYDNLLESAFQQAGVGLNRVVRGGDVNFIHPDRLTLIKLYGDAQQPDTLVVTDRDHSDLLRDREKEALLDEVRRTLRRNTVLFLGYNLADPDFRFLFDQIAESRFARTAYAVWPGLSKTDVQMWRDRGIVILDEDPLGETSIQTATAPNAVVPEVQYSPGHVWNLPIEFLFRGNWQSLRDLAGSYIKTFRSNTIRRVGLTYVGRELATANDDDWAISVEATIPYRGEWRTGKIGQIEALALDGGQVLARLSAVETFSEEVLPFFVGLFDEAKARGLVEETAESSYTPPAGPKPGPSPPSSRRQRAWVRFKLQIARLADLEFEVRAFETPMGEPHAAGHLPYDSTNLIAVLKALEFGQYHPDQFTSPQTEAMQKLGLLRNARLVPDLLPRIGEGLYQSLFPKQVGAAFQMALNQARGRRETVALQLRFDQDAVTLARYPWELLHDGHRHLLSGGAVELTRYIAYPEAATALPVPPPWRLLYIAAHPQDLAPLPDDTERLAVWNGLRSLAEAEMLTLDRLDPPTYDALLDQMTAADYHILHFDGHGVFARRCLECATMHSSHLITCRSCDAPLDDVPSLGYLAFEDEYGDADYVSTEAMENLLLGSEARLIFLSACQSAVVQGESLFGGLGPGLIRAGVPAVVAMQLSVSVEAALNFATGFYKALAQGETVPRAVAQGRRRLFRDKTWFIPILYLRSADDEGRLFVEQQQLRK